MIRTNGWHNIIITFGISALALILMLSIAGAANHAETEIYKGNEVVAGEVLVKFRTSEPQVIEQAVIEEDVDEKEYVGSNHVLRIHSRSKNVDKLIYGLSKRADVLYVEPNYIIHPTDIIPNDPSFGLLWGLNNAAYPDADISAPLAWDISTGSTANVVAVIDTGVDYTHPDLATNIWSAPTDFTVTIGGSSITCPAGSHGFNAITNNCNPLDDNNHGTHVSGTIGAVGNNGIGIVGVNWNTRIMGVKFLSASGSGSTSNAIKSIEFAIKTKEFFKSTGGANVRVLSNSWGGGGFSQALLDQINYANSADMLFVAAAGNSASNNDATSSYPSNYAAPNVVAVAATDNNDKLASFSSYGLTTVDLGAPGVSVYSTTKAGNYDTYSGTSMATPHVSGAAILILSKCALTTAELKMNILNNVDPIISLEGKTVTGGRLNVNKAIRVCSAPPTPDFSLSTTPSSLSIVQGTSKTSTITVSSLSGFTGIVNLEVSGITNAVVGVGPTSVTNSGTSTLTVNAGTATPGIYKLTITGTNGSLTHTTTVMVTITAPPSPDFSISASPTSRTVNQKASTSYAVTIARSYGFAGVVNLSVTGLPSGALYIFNPSQTIGNSSTLSITTGSSTPAGSYMLKINGTSGSIIHTTLVTLNVKRRR